MANPAADTWFVYILRCADDTLYTGIARDVAARLHAHETGRGARYTRARGPLTLCAVRRCASKGQALSLERSIKLLRRADKQTLLRGRRLGAFARACELERAQRAAAKTATATARTATARTATARTATARTARTAKTAATKTATTRARTAKTAATKTATTRAAAASARVAA